MLGHGEFAYAIFDQKRLRGISLPPLRRRISFGSSSCVNVEDRAGGPNFDAQIPVFKTS
jgi:hypothetical protein